MAEHDIFGDVSDSDDDDDDIQAAASDGDIMKAGATINSFENYEYRLTFNLWLPWANIFRNITSLDPSLKTTWIINIYQSFTVYYESYPIME